MAEIALLEAEMGVAVTQLTHIPGLSNDGPDALSRISAPEAKKIPASSVRSSGLAAQSGTRLFGDQCYPLGSADAWD